MWEKSGSPRSNRFLRSSQSGSTLVRVITAFALIPIVLSVLWVPQLELGFLALVAAFGFVGAREFYHIATAKGRSPESTLGQIACVAMVCATWWNNLSIVLLVFFVALMLAALLPILRGHISMDDLTTTVFGLVYVGVIGAHFPLLHMQPVIGAGLVTMALTAVILSDTGAYFTGRAIGRHKLAPKVSPGKTIEGSIGGILGAAVGMLVIYGIREYLGTERLPDWHIARYVVVGVVLAVASQVGDLMESMLKRDAGVKDSGNILPGHGGVLDRCDGILFAGPVMYYLLNI